MKELSLETIENILKNASYEVVNNSSKTSNRVEGSVDDLTIVLRESRNGLYWKCYFDLSQADRSLETFGSYTSYIFGEKPPEDCRARDLFVKYAVPQLYETALKEMQENEKLVDDITQKYAPIKL